MKMAHLSAAQDDGGLWDDMDKLDVLQQLFPPLSEGRREGEGLEGLYALWTDEQLHASATHLQPALGVEPQGPGSASGMVEHSASGSKTATDTTDCSSVSGHSSTPPRLGNSSTPLNHLNTLVVSSQNTGYLEPALPGSLQIPECAQLALPFQLQPDEHFSSARGTARSSWGLDPGGMFGISGTNSSANSAMLSQALAHAEATGLAVPAQARSRGGRKPQIGTKPYRDAKRDNRNKLTQLAEECQEKLRLVTKLEQENEDLKRRARLLEHGVHEHEHAMARKVDPNLNGNLRSLLASFKSKYSKANAELLLSRMLHITKPEEMTLEVLRSCWQALVAEMAELLMHAPSQTADQEECEMSDKVKDFVMAVCTTSASLISQLVSINFITGELNPQQQSPQEGSTYWIGVAERMALSDSQVKDLCATHQMLMLCLTRIEAQQSNLKIALNAAIAGLAERQGSLLGASCAMQTDAVSDVAEGLKRNLTHHRSVITLFAFVALRIVSPRQCCQLCVYGSPLFPNLKVFLAEIYASKYGRAAPV